MSLVCFSCARDQEMRDDVPSRPRGWTARWAKIEVGRHIDCIPPLRNQPRRTRRSSLVSGPAPTTYESIAARERRGAKCTNPTRHRSYVSRPPRPPPPFQTGRFDQRSQRWSEILRFAALPCTVGRFIRQSAFPSNARAFRRQIRHAIVAAAPRGPAEWMRTRACRDEKRLPRMCAEKADRRGIAQCPELRVAARTRRRLAEPSESALFALAGIGR